jgi:NAD(P)-dependent dehydrogenase (short-subunit alcohol dehydrogenase family)
VCHIPAKSSVYEVRRKETEMKVLVIGATGAVGFPLVLQLVERGHRALSEAMQSEQRGRCGVDPLASHEHRIEER